MEDDDGLALLVVSLHCLRQECKKWRSSAVGSNQACTWPPWPPWPCRRYPSLHWRCRQLSPSQRCEWPP